MSVFLKKPDWYKLYDNYINSNYKSFDDYFRIKIKLKKPFLKLVYKYHRIDMPLLECGCGTGKFSIHLASLGFNSYAIDKDETMLKEAKEKSNLISPENSVTFLSGNIKKIPFPDNYFSITHSSGVLEHFSDDDIINLINEQLRVSFICIFSVPTKYFQTKMYGDERFLDKKHWRDIIKKSNGILVEESGYHYKTFKNRLLDLIKNPNKIFSPIALYIFVVKRKESNYDLYS